MAENNAVSFFDELKRRNVVRVGVAYMVAAWVVLQIIYFVVDAISAPNWIVQVFILVAAIGLPVVLAISWAFELTPEGVKRESEIDRSQPIPDTSIEEAGVRSIEHGFLISQETLRPMKKNDVWLSMQPILNDEDADEFPNPESNRKFVEVTKGTETIYLPVKSDKQHVYIRRGLVRSSRWAPERGSDCTRTLHC